MKNSRIGALFVDSPVDITRFYGGYATRAGLHTYEVKGQQLICNIPNTYIMFSWKINNKPYLIAYLSNLKLKLCPFYTTIQL